jgi:hypothetical protein
MALCFRTGLNPSFLTLNKPICSWHQLRCSMLYNRSETVCRNGISVRVVYLSVFPESTSDHQATLVACHIGRSNVHAVSH